MKKSSIAKTLRTNIADLEDLGGDLSDEQLGRVAGGLTVTICDPNGKNCLTFEVHMCAKDTASLTREGTPDTSSDSVSD